MKNSLHRTAAFSLAALILYIPANYFPILKIDMYGATSVNTVWDGVKTLWQEGDWTVSTIVFLASIAIPLVKLTGLFTLVITAWLRLPQGKMPRTWLYRFIDLIGPWAMLDVFVLAVLVSLVKLHRLATVLPGEGVLAFGGVVIFTLLASQSYDPQLIWEKATDEQ